MKASEFSPQVGAQGVASWVVGPEHLADALGNDGVMVLATPMLLDLMEIAADRALSSALPKDWVTLGTLADFKHLKLTPLGFQVTARATVTAVDRQKIRFQIEVHDDLDLIGEGWHERFCLPKEDFLAMVQAKRAARPTSEK